MLTFATLLDPFADNRLRAPAPLGVIVGLLGAVKVGAVDQIDALRQRVIEQRMGVGGRGARAEVLTAQA